MEVCIDARFRGPSDSANGGYTCGLVAGLAGGEAEVTLRRPPPLGRLLPATWEGETVVVRDGDEVVAEAVAASLELDVPEPVSYDAATRASSRYRGFERHDFPNCFVCGPERAPGDGLRIFAAPVDGRDAVAAPWVPAQDLADADGVVRPEIVWAELDCPGAFAVGFGERGTLLLGRLLGRIRAPVRAGEPHVVLGWSLGEDGRKFYAGTVLFAASGALCAFARATWLAPAAQ